MSTASFSSRTFSFVLLNSSSETSFYNKIAHNTHDSQVKPGTCFSKVFLVSFNMFSQPGLLSWVLLTCSNSSKRSSTVFFFGGRGNVIHWLQNVLNCFLISDSCWAMHVFSCPSQINGKLQSTNSLGAINTPEIEKSCQITVYTWEGIISYYMYWSWKEWLLRSQSFLS